MNYIYKTYVVSLHHHSNIQILETENILIAVTHWLVTVLGPYTPSMILSAIAISGGFRT